LKVIVISDKEPELIALWKELKIALENHLKKNRERR